jgi:hypothetical protein
MSKPISLFSGYSQSENRVTNYCLLVLKMLYEENPKYLKEFLENIFDGELTAEVGVPFRQQEKGEQSVPDGLIMQDAFTIHIETKMNDNFSEKQLKAHLEGLKNILGSKVLLVLGRFENEGEKLFIDIREECRVAHVIFHVISFDDFLAGIEVKSLPKNLADTVRDLMVFMDEQRLLSSWRNSLVVVPCGKYPEDVIEHNVYMCPTEGSAYKHRRARFFGMYRNKCVERVAEIEAVIDVRPDGNTCLLWNNIIGADKEILSNRAKVKVQELRPNGEPTRIFLLGPSFQTNFAKDTVLRP